jgi:hypothetical protein
VRWPRVRFTLRTLLVAVAIAAVILGLWGRSDRFRSIALDFEMERETLIGALDAHLLPAARPGETPEREAERRQAARPLLAYDDYLSKMADKYYRASSRPWLPVLSDPAPPPRPTWEEVRDLIVRYNLIAGDAAPEPPVPRPRSEVLKDLVDRQKVTSRRMP